MKKQFLSHKGRERKVLPDWLAGESDRLLKICLARATANPKDMPKDSSKEEIAEMRIMEPKDRLGYAKLLVELAHSETAYWAKNSDPKKVKDATAEAHEKQLERLAEEGDRTAILALLKAKMPEKYGEKSDDDLGDDNDVIDWTPMVRQ
jgi:hypothetical protein